MRLANIDALEEDQRFGKESRDSLLQMAGRKQVQIESLATVRYGRIVGLIKVEAWTLTRNR